MPFVPPSTVRRFEPVVPAAVLSYITLVPAVPAVLPAVAGTADSAAVSYTHLTLPTSDLV